MMTPYEQRQAAKRIAKAVYRTMCKELGVNVGDPITHDHKCIVALVLVGLSVLHEGVSAVPRNARDA